MAGVASFGMMFYPSIKAISSSELTQQADINVCSIFSVILTRNSGLLPPKIDITTHFGLPKLVPKLVMDLVKLWITV